MWSGLSKAVAEDPSGVDLVVNTRLESTPKRKALSPSVDIELAWVIELESGWNPKAQNPISRATGLIQFMPSTAKSLGTDVDDLIRMSRSEQAPYVQKFFDKVTDYGKRKVDRIGDVYILVFAPNHLTSSDDKVIYAEGSAGWEQNKGLRTPNNGPITAGSVRARGTPPSSSIVKVPPSSQGKKPPPKSPPPRGGNGAGGWIALLAIAWLTMRGSRKWA